MKFKVNNKEVFASTGGRPFDENKPLIIFVHGSGLSHITWVLQTRYFAFHGYSVLAIDLPGHGYSEGPAIPSIEDQGKWISDVIDNIIFRPNNLDINMIYKWDQDNPLRYIYWLLAIKDNDNLKILYRKLHLAHHKFFIQRFSLTLETWLVEFVSNTCTFISLDKSASTKYFICRSVYKY